MKTITHKRISNILYVFFGIVILYILVFSCTGCATANCATYTKYKPTPKAYGMSHLQNYYSPRDYKHK